MHDSRVNLEEALQLYQDLGSQQNPSATDCYASGDTAILTTASLLIR